jgi:enoyl-CoA hydratase
MVLVKEISRPSLIQSSEIRCKEVILSNIIVTPSYRDHRGIGLIQLNRPNVLNALNTETLVDIVETLESWSDIRAVIITGSDKAFSAGADIKKMAEASAMDQLLDQREKLWKRFSMIRYPIIAAVNGFCLGGGHELAMSCDLIIAGDKAKFGQPEINIGTVPGAGGTQRFTKAMGKSKAMYYALTGEMINAAEARELGLVAKVVPASTLMQETFVVAKRIASKSPVASSLIKESINQSFEMSLSQGLMLERRNFYLTFASDDQKEGMNAFLEKRTPDYKGN